jgi:hypothetical protein
MKLTKSQLKQIIKEELERVLKEAPASQEQWRQTADMMSSLGSTGPGGARWVINWLKSEIERRSKFSWSEGPEEILQNLIEDKYSGLIHFAEGKGKFPTSMAPEDVTPEIVSAIIEKIRANNYKSLDILGQQQ